MTIGITAICNHGRNIICATDGMLSAEVCADLSAFKMQFFGDWLFLFAGTLSNADLIMEELRQEEIKDPSVLSRQKIQSALKRAYAKRRAEWVTDRVLTPYEMTLDDFKKTGAKTFGEKVFPELDLAIRQEARNFNEDVMVTGWGKTEQSAMIYTVMPDGAFSSAYDGFATIGCGGSVAQNTLMLLKCARHQPFEYALYAVAAAKFAAENCEGVGRSTAMLVTRKPKSKDDKWWNFIQPEHEALLRVEWEKYSKPRIPVQSIPTLCRIAQEVMGEVSPHLVMQRMAQSLQLAGFPKSRPGRAKKSGRPKKSGRK